MSPRGRRPRPVSPAEVADLAGARAQGADRETPLFMISVVAEHVQDPDPPRRPVALREFVRGNEVAHGPRRAPLFVGDGSGWIVPEITWTHARECALGEQIDHDQLARHVGLSELCFRSVADIRQRRRDAIGIGKSRVANERAWQIYPRRNLQSPTLGKGNG